MSRAYRIRVRESLQRVIRAEDHVSTQLELLEILPTEQMAELMAKELEGRGFRRDGKNLVRSRQGVTITVEPETGTVTVASAVAEQVALQGETESRVYRDAGRDDKDDIEKALRKDLRQGLEKQAREQVQTKATETLESQLAELRQELDQAINRVTAEALKRKAAQLGQIKEMTEDPATGSLTIVLEV